MEPTLSFGPVDIRPHQRTVLVDGQAAPLGARAFDILLALVEHRDRVVSKNELLEIVWPGLVVEENNLAVHVSALRRVLGPHAIATVPGRGYRFAATLDMPAAPPAAAVAPPPEAAEARPPLPMALATLWGREEDFAALGDLLRAGRLTTLAGAGGIGKTTLALATAHAQRAAWRDGVAWVELADLDDAAFVARAVARAVGVPVVENADPLPALAAALRPLRTLVVIDNAEHRLDGVVPLVQAILAGTPGVSLLVTSQVPLKIDGERVFRLRPLAVPAPEASIEEAQANGAVALFVDQARAVDRRFALTADNVATVVDLCRQLDGVALAIKLAAARMPLLGLQGLAARLGDRLRLLTNGPRSAPARQQTLQNALAWSHELLAEPERQVLRRLAVFAGGFSLEMAGRVAASDTLDDWQVIDALGELVDRSLVDMDGAARPRYRLLDPARHYARLKLDEAGEREATQARLAEGMATLMDDAYEAYWTTADSPWLESVEPEIDNARAALAWSTRERPEVAIRLIGAASVLFLQTGQAPEARRHFAVLEAAASADASPAGRRYWIERSRLHMGISGALMSRFALHAASLSRAAGDGRGLYLALRCAAGSGALDAGEAAALVEEMRGLERPGWPPRLRLQRCMTEISALGAAGDLTRARSACEDVLRQATAAGLDSVVAVALVGLASADLALAQPELALRSALAYADAPGVHRGNLILQALAIGANALLVRQEVGAARALVVRLVAASRIRDWEWFGLYADLFALLAVAEGRLEAAARLAGHADAAVRRAGPRDLNAVRARSQVAAALEASLSVQAMARLAAEGETLDEEALCALALAGESGPR